jgi:valyl-tRNA synthetase
MIIAGYEYRGEYPFKNVYLTGIVRDKQGRKMSKSLGNSPDPIDLIKKYGADGVRTGMMFSSPAGNDLPFDEKLCEQGRNFSNKIWNAFRLVKGWEVKPTTEKSNQDSETSSGTWFRSRLNATIAEVNDHYSKFRMSDALLSCYNLIWNDFCSQYLEMVKPAYVDGISLPIEKKAYDEVVEFFDELMRLVHPWMPFLSEEIWQELKERQENDSICIAEFPTGGDINKELLADFDVLFELVSWVRNTRSSKGMSPKEALALSIKATDKTKYENVASLIQKLANISEITFTENAVSGSGVSLVIKGDEFGIDLGDAFDAEAEREKLQTELDYTIGFKKSVEKKLANERFVQNAKPEIVDREREKLADAESKIKAIEEALKKLS